MGESPRPFAARERVVDAAAVVSDVVVARASLRENRLGFRAIPLALVLVVLQPRAQGERHRTPECHAGIAKQRQRVLDMLTRLVRATHRELDIGELRQQRRLESPRADRLGEREPALDERPRLGVAIAEGQQRALAFQREHLGEAIAELDGESARGFDVGEAFFEFQQEEPAEADHPEVGDRGARESVRIA